MDGCDVAFAWLRLLLGGGALTSTLLLALALAFAVLLVRLAITRITASSIARVAVVVALVHVGAS